MSASSTMTRQNVHRPVVTVTIEHPEDHQTIELRVLASNVAYNEDGSGVVFTWDNGQSLEVPNEFIIHPQATVEEMIGMATRQPIATLGAYYTNDEGEVVFLSASQPTPRGIR